MYKKIYPYLILLACCLLSFSVIGISNNFGLFYEYYCQEFNVSRATVTISSTIISLASGLSEVFLPSPIKNKLGSKKSLIIIAIITISVMSLSNIATSIYYIYLIALVFGMVCGTFGGRLISELLETNFEKSGGYFGIALSFTGVFGIIFSPVVVRAIENHGWRYAFNIYTLCLLITFIYIILIIKDEKVTVKHKKKESVINKEILIMFVYCVLGRGLAVLGLQSLSYASTIGLSAIDGATLSSVANVGNLIFKLILGYLSDKIGAVKTTIVHSICLLIGGIIYFFKGFDSFTVLIIGAFFIGATYATLNVIARPLCSDYFGKENTTRYFASFGFASMLFGIVQPVIAYSSEVFGNYNVAIVIAEFFQILGVILIIRMFKKKEKHETSYNR